MESIGSFNTSVSMQEASHSLHPDAIHKAINRKYPKACIVCRTRKVKCDRKFPCGTCKRWAISDCVYPSPVRVSPRPKKDEARSTGKARDSNENAFLERVRQLELLVLNLDGNIPAIPAKDSMATLRERSRNLVIPHEGHGAGSVTAQLHSTAHSFKEGERINVSDDVTLDKKGLGKLLVKDDQSRYLSEGFWVDVDQEEDFDIFVDTPRSNTSAAADSVLSQQTYQTFPFGSGMNDIRWMHPTPSQVQLFGRVFCERVGPLFKVLHKLTLEVMLQAGTGTLGKSKDALLFAVFYSAVTSLSNDEVVNHLQIERSEAIQNYKFALEQALMNANLLETQEIVTLQAFALYLVCSWCNSEVKSVWTMSGLSMRLAESMGLRRDGTLRAFAAGN